MTLPRFDYIANDIQEALHYYHNRAIQLLSAGWSWDGTYIDLDWGIQVQLYKDGVAYDSVYVLTRGKGHLSEWFRSKKRNFVTMHDCEAMHSWLVAKDITHTVAVPDRLNYNPDYHHVESFDCLNKSYERVEAFYGETRAKRSRMFYMNHIDEGIYILSRMKSLAKRKVDFKTVAAYCLHPLYQEDASLAKNWNYNSTTKLERESIILATEYRNVANSHLPVNQAGLKHRFEDIRLSPIEEVNTMLWADKIQNRKDFELYINLNPEAPYERNLQAYFEAWFNRLQIPESFYQHMVGEINRKTGYLTYKRSVQLLCGRLND